MYRFAASLLVLGIVVLGVREPLGAQTEGAEVPIRFSGNCAVTNEVYLQALDLPADLRADDAGALLVEQKLWSFLRDAGYDLASVTVVAHEGVLEASINEGRLEKITFLGKGSFRTLQFRLGLELPCRVFNRPHLERQLESLGKKYGISRARYELIRVDRSVEASSSSLPGVGELNGQLHVVHEVGRYDLYVHLGGSGWGEGFDAGLGYRRSEGGFLKLGFSSSHLVLRGDRWKLQSLLASNLRDRLDTGETYLSLTRLQMEGTWYSPELGGVGLRPYLWVMGDLSSWQRPDLDMETYYSGVLDASLNVGFEIWPGVMLSLGGGMQRRQVGGIEQWDSAEFVQSPYSLWRPFVSARAELRFRAAGYRKDRRHAMDLQIRRSFESGNACDRATLTYDWTRPFGWHDLLVRVQGVHLAGVVHFDEDEPVGGRYIRGVFSNEFFVREAASLQVEFRFSVARDVIKIGVFHDGAAFGSQARGKSTQGFRVADSTGLGLHFLLLDSFQFDTWYAIGFSSGENPFDHGLVLQLKKVF